MRSNRYTHRAGGDVNTAHPQALNADTADDTATLNREPAMQRTPPVNLKAWLKQPVSETLCETLDRLTDIYNAGVADGSITPPPAPEPIPQDYGQVSPLAERYERCLAFCKQRGLPTDAKSVAHYMGEPVSAVQALQQEREIKENTCNTSTR